FDDPRDSAGPLGSQDSGAAASKWIEDYAIAATAVADQIRNQCNRFYGWMKFEVTVPRRIKAIDARAFQNIGAVATLSAEPKIIYVRPSSAFEDRDELVFRAVEATLA